MSASGRSWTELTRNVGARFALEARPFRGIALSCVAYLACKLTFFFSTERYGLVSPSGSVNLGVAALGLLLLGLTLLVTFVVPIWITYRIARRISARWAAPIVARPRRVV
jgi:hypothetical protein